MILAFTGHRPDKLFQSYSTNNERYKLCYQATLDALKQLKPDKAISGMALGFDQLAANCCIELNIPFIAAVPFAGQESVWPESSKQLYHKLLDKALEIVIVSPGGYAAYKMQVRNEWMVDNSDELLSCWDGTPGGTCNCVMYASKCNKKIHRLDPNNNFERSILQ